MKFSQLYTRLCRIAGKSESLKNIQSPPEDLRQNLKLADLNVSGREVVALAFLGILVGAAIAGTVLITAWFFEIPIAIFLITIPLPILFYFSIGWYPSWKSEKEQTKSMEGAPRLISYLVVELKINPNLEKAAKFSAEHAEDSLRSKFRSELWKVCISTHNNVEEALTRFGRIWGEKSQELKRSIDLIKSSISENSEKSRKEVLNQALKTCFEGIQNRMESFAADLQLPTTLIYGIGVLLPLVLLAVLPVLSSTGFKINGLELGIIYCVVLPLTIYLLKKQVLAKRPAAFAPPNIPSKDNRRKALLISALIFLTPSFAAFAINLETPLLALTFVWSLGSAISAFCYLSSFKTFRIRKKNQKLEEEFHDALTQLGNQLKSGRPAEDAFRRTAKTTKGSELSKILKKTSTNLKVGGMSTQSAFFDPREGSLKEVHSTTIKNTFRILTDLLNRSSQAAGEAILHITSHLKRLKDVENQIRRSLRDVVSSMKSVATFFAPLVASITVQLQQLISEKTTGIPLFGSAVQISSPTFLGVLGFYVIVLTVLLSSYTVEIERGNDSLLKRMEIARTLPVAMVVFTIGLVLGGQMLSALTG